MKEVSCLSCGEKLFRYPSQIIGKKYGAFCDRHCLGKFRTENLVKQHAANYKKGSRKSRDYIEVEASWHLNKNSRGYIFLHRLIAEAAMGRFLSKDEVVHHLDGNPRNNHWDNLSVMKQKDHAKEHDRQRNKYGQFQNKSRNNSSTS